VLTTLFLGSDGPLVMPLTIVAVVVAYLTANWLTPPPAAAQQPASPAERAPAGPDVPAPRTPVGAGAAPAGESGALRGAPAGPGLPHSG
jgi:hypothetical protein